MENNIYLRQDALSLAVLKVTSLFTSLDNKHIVYSESCGKDIYFSWSKNGLKFCDELKARNV